MPIDVTIPLHPVTAVKRQSTLGVIKQSKLIPIPNKILREVTVPLPKNERVSKKLRNLSGFGVTVPLRQK